MNLPAGTRLGVYEITGLIGEGGMGQVYRATDTTLGRAVAIKILPAAFAADAERVARFEREAKTLASLNHPHIAAIYGFEKSADGHALIMELVEGEDLAQRLRAGALPTDEVVAIAKQIADAIGDAHERGIVHRDLKPANIKVTPDGAVKVLDFGLAKAMEQGSGIGDQRSAALANSPTITTPAMTQAGVILGTAAYMSPEQAKGRGADKRSDIWSFGCVVFEMLTAQKAFAGEDVSETLAAILRAEPDLTKLPNRVPANLRAIIDGCLKKDRKQRFADIAVVQYLLNGDQGPAAATASNASTFWKVAAAILGVTTIAAIGIPAMVRRPPAPLEITRFPIAPPEKSTFVTAGRTGTTVAISPDGKKLAYTMRDAAGTVQIWIRSLDALEAVPLAGTDDAEFPFWSPDGLSVAFFAGGKLKRIDVAGGTARTLCDAAGARGGTWGVNGEIVVGGGALGGSGLGRVRAAGGELKRFTTAPIGDHRFPSFLPDGRHVFFYWQAQGATEQGLYVTDLETGQPVRLATADTSAIYAAPGVILFGRQSSLFAQPFDAAALKLSGDPIVLADHLESNVFGGVIAFSVSNGGTLAYGIGTGRSNDTQITWFDRQGKPVSTIGPPGNYFGLELSPDGKELAVHRHENGVGGDLWTMDLARGTVSRLTFNNGQDNSSPIWSPDGRRIGFTSLRDQTFGSFAKSANGTGPDQRLVDARNSAPRSFSADGKWLFYVTAEKANNQTDIWVAPLDGGTPRAVLNSRFLETDPAMSPDGKWLAYTSDESGRPEIYVRSFPNDDGKWQVSTAGGLAPRWRRDSKELFFLDRAQLGSMMSVEVSSAAGAFSASAPRVLFQSLLSSFAHPGPLGWAQYDVTADGQRFVMPTNGRVMSFNDSASPPMVIVSNWAAALKK